MVWLAVLIGSQPLLWGGPSRELFKGRANGIGDEAMDIDVADFNGDGLLDLVTASYAAPYVSVLLATGSGFFAPELRVPSMSLHRAVVAAEINGDGWPDLVARRNPEGVSVWLGTGGGAFGEGVFIPTYETCGLCFGLAVDDLDRDGRSDIVVGGDPVRILFGTGDGAFAPATPLSASGGESFVLIGKFDDDDELDILDERQVWLGTGQRGFVRVASSTPGFDGVAHDFDGDGRLDVATAAHDVEIHLGVGEGRFAAPVEYPTSMSARAIALADLNSDGNPDIVTSWSEASHCEVLLSNGDGTFLDAVSHEVPRGGSMVGGEFSGDGHDDVAFASRFGAATLPMARSEFNRQVALAFVVRGDGHGGLAPETVKRYAVGMRPVAVLSSDLDGDGDTDVVTANRDSGDVSILLGKGDGTFADAESAGVGGAPAALAALAAGTFDAGEILDLAVANEGTGDVSVLLGQGDGSFVHLHSIPVGTSPVAIVRADFNSDTLQDLATANSGSNDVAVLLGLGGGSFASPVVYTVGDEPVSLVATRLDTDGPMDLVVANGGTGDLSVLHGNGDGTFATEVRHQAEGLLQRIIAVDVNNDGSEDLALVAFDAPHVRVFHGDGAGGLSQPVGVVLGTRARDAAIVDLDGDGWKDLVVSHSGASIFSVSRGGENGFASDSREEFLGDGEGRLVADDFDGDGLVDVGVAGFWANRFAVFENLTPFEIRFDSAIAYSWPRLVNADQYSQYRGQVADLREMINSAAGPGGYGECRNETDPDLGDTRFVDSEVPDPGAGFFYLMSIVRDGLEGGLGATSAGQPRQADVPCVIPLRSARAD